MMNVVRDRLYLVVLKIFVEKWNKGVFVFEFVCEVNVVCSIIYNLILDMDMLFFEVVNQVIEQFNEKFMVFLDGVEDLVI